MTKFKCELYISARLYFLSLQKQLKKSNSSGFVERIRIQNQCCQCQGPGN